MGIITELPKPDDSNTGWPWTWESDECSLDNPPKISIVTPSYNQGGFIEATLRSVLLQNYANLEYIVMDGGSTDDSVKIIERYGHMISDWKTGPDEGQYHAINEGFSQSTGDIMLWLNSDDMLFPNALNRVAEIFSCFDSVEWLTGMQVFFNETGKAIQFVETIPYNRWLMRHGCYESRTIHWVMQEATVWRRSLWKRAGGYIETRHSLAGDFELWHRFSQQAQLYNASTLIGGNRQHQDQKTALFNTYESEVDDILRGNSISLAMNRLLSISFFRKIARSYLLSRKNNFSIDYDSQSSSWRSQKSNC